MQHADGWLLLAQFNEANERPIDLASAREVFLRQFEFPAPTSNFLSERLDERLIPAGPHAALVS